MCNIEGIEYNVIRNENNIFLNNKGMPQKHADKIDKNCNQTVQNELNENKRAL